MTCELCDGEGYVTFNGEDSSGNIEVGVNQKKCECKLDYEE